MPPLPSGTDEQIPSYPYVPFFAPSRLLLEEILPARADVEASFGVADFHIVASRVVTQTIAPDWMAYADKLAVGGDSVLARLSRQDFEAGLAAMRRYAVAEGGRPVVEPIDLFVLSARDHQPMKLDL